MNDNHDTSLLYRRDFIILKKNQQELAQPIPDKFSHDEFFKYDVYSHELLETSQFLIRRKMVGVYMLGYALNPYTGANNNDRITQHLAKLLSESFNNFLNYLDQLSGRFVLLCKVGDKEFLLQDAMGYRCALYSYDQNNFMIASHTKLFENLLGFQKCPKAISISQQKNYSMGGNYLPGVMTAISNVRPLLANTLLDLKTLKTERFFPREELKSNELTDEFITNICKVLVKQSGMITDRYNTIFSLTGGLDSRMTLSTLQPFINRLSKVFTYVINGNKSHKKDVDIAPKIAEKIGLSNFLTMNVSRTNLKDGEFLDLAQKEVNSGIKKSSSDMIALFLTGVNDPKIVHIMSYGPEVFNCYFTRNPINRDGKLSLVKLARLYKRSLVDLTLDSWAEFIEVHDPLMESKHGYCPYDLLYWEHRNSAWLGTRMSDTDMIADTFVPYNNRELLKALLTIKQETRLTKDIHKSIVEKCWPALMEIDFT